MTYPAQRQPFKFAFKPGDRVSYLAKPNGPYNRNYSVPAVIIAASGGKFQVKGVRETLEDKELFEANATHVNLFWRQRPCRALGEPHPRYDTKPIIIYDDFTGDVVMRFNCYEDYEAALQWSNSGDFKAGDDLYAGMMHYAATYKANAAAHREAATIR